MTMDTGMCMQEYESECEGGVCKKMLRCKSDRSSVLPLDLYALVRLVRGEVMNKVPSRSSA